MRKMILASSITATAILAFGTLTLARPEVTKAQGGSHSMKIALTGGAEKPGPGDPDGSGTVDLTLNHDKGEVCYEITTKDIQTVTAAHVHLGAIDKAGPPKVTLKKAADGTWKSCVGADKALLNDIQKNPGNYYVNVHNAEFPNGALRGQLGK